MKKIIRWFAYKYVDYHAFKREIEKIKYGASGKKRTTTSKLLVFYIFINLTIVEAFSLYMINYTMDTDALSTLITSIIAEGFAYAIYSAKALKENISKYGSNCNITIPHDDDDASG